jgi:tetratricopeptide (TPR) repeat protein/transglutaminase-like putative cysteine protease
MVLVAGCAALPKGTAVPAPALVHGGQSAEVDRLVEDFYGAGLLPEQAASRADELLRAHPGASRAHEVAAFAALLAGDGERAWSHFAAAAADLDADATELYLWELGFGPRARDHALMELCDGLRQKHPRAGVRALATQILARLADKYGRFEEASQLAQSLAPLGEWQVLGALDNDQGKGFLTAFPPEEKIDLAAEVPGPLVPLHWRKVEKLTRLGAVPLMNLLWPREFAAAYLATWVRSDSERTAQLRITTASPARAFVNGGLVLSEEQVASGDFDNLIAPITLHAGWNQILIKSAHKRGGSWLMRARISSEDGAPLGGLTQSSTQQPFTASPARESTDTLRAAGPPGGPDGRRHLIESRLYMRDGRERPALAALQELLDARPGNLLAQYYGALAYWDNDELGKAIDLLNQGVAATGGRAGAFLVKRGRYYLQKQLWEKAQNDLTAATALARDGRSAEAELAELYEKRGWLVDRCQLLQQMLHRWPDDAWAMRERAECLDGQGYAEAAEKLLAQAAALVPGDDETGERRFELARRRNDFKAARQFVAALERLSPTSPNHVLEEADLLRRQGDAVGARAKLELAAKLSPELPFPWEKLGNLAYERAQKDAALAAWKRAQERDPNNSALAQRVEFLEPTRLGFIEKFVPSEADIDRALGQKFRTHAAAQVALLLDHEVTEVNADGSARRVITQVSQALDEKGRDAITHERLPTHGTLKILRAYSVDKSGDRQEASSIRGGEVRFRNLQVGSRTVVQYVHYMPVGHFLPGAYVGRWYFQTVGRQSEDSTWVLVLPRGRAVHEEMIGEVNEKKSTDGDRDVRVYHAAHVGPLVQESHMPPADDLLMQVDVSTVDNWEDYVRWERALLADAFHSNSTLDALTDKLIGGAREMSPREKLDRLFHQVAEEIRYQQDYETTIAGVRPHAASAVVERGYGDCKDKAVLLIQMARRAGIKLHFAILRTTPAGRVRREVPNQQFNHAIVWVPRQDGIDQPFFMDPTSDGLDMGNLRADDQGAVSLVMDPESGKWEFREIPYQAPELQYDHHKIRIDVKSPTEAVAKDELTLRGSIAMGLRHVLRNQGEAKKLFETLAAAIFPGSTLRDGHTGSSQEDLWHPLGLSLEMDASQEIRAEEQSWRLTVPGSFHLSGLVTLKKRETPMRLGAPDSSSYDIETVLPDGYQLSHAPKDFAVEHPCFTVSRKAQVEPRKVTLHLEYARRCTDVGVAEYGAFRDKVQEALHKLNDDVVFAEAPKPVTKKK